MKAVVAASNFEKVRWEFYFLYQNIIKHLLHVTCLFVMDQLVNDVNMSSKSLITKRPNIQSSQTLRKTACWFQQMNGIIFSLCFVIIIIATLHKICFQFIQSNDIIRESNVLGCIYCIRINNMTKLQNILYFHDLKIPGWS